MRQQSSTRELLYSNEHSLLQVHTIDDDEVFAPRRTSIDQDCRVTDARRRRVLVEGRIALLPPHRFCGLLVKQSQKACSASAERGVCQRSFERSEGCQKRIPEVSLSFPELILSSALRGEWYRGKLVSVASHLQVHTAAQMNSSDRDRSSSIPSPSASPRNAGFAARLSWLMRISRRFNSCMC